MPAIFLADLDDKLVDILVEAEIIHYDTRVLRVSNELINAFQLIAPEDVFIRNHIEFHELEMLAALAAAEWVDFFNSRVDRRVVLIRLFPEAEEIINSFIQPSNDHDWIEKFGDSIDVAGFPRHWSESLRGYAMIRGYNPSAAINKYHNDPHFTLDDNDKDFIKNIIDTHDDENTP